MSKLCDRDYKKGSMLSVEMIDGLAHCPLCKKPVLCHGRDVAGRALFWALSGDTGISSETLACHMLKYPPNRFNAPPSDADDRGRCIRLLELIPEWIPRLPEMVKYDKQNKEVVVISSSGISAETNSWQKQIPLILTEGKL